MSLKAVSSDGLLYFFKCLKDIFVRQESGKGLSSNDFTTDEKTKLFGIETGANKITVVDNLDSTSNTDALSSNQGRILNEKIKAFNDNVSNLGGGDMLKSVYDTNNNGKVDDADKLGGQAPSYYAKAEDVSKKANTSDLHKVATSGNYEDLENKPTNFAPSSHKHQQDDINGLDTLVDSITEIASGKCKSKVFDTVADLDEWLKVATNTATLNVGDVFLVKAIDVPDYWWDGSAKQQLETTKVEIEYITNEEIDTIVAT